VNRPSAIEGLLDPQRNPAAAGTVVGMAMVIEATRLSRWRMLLPTFSVGQDLLNNTFGNRCHFPQRKSAANR